MKKQLLSILVLILSAPCFAQSEETRIRTVGPEDERVGRWIASFTVAGGVDVAPALALRDVLMRTFIGRSGGYYGVAADLNDLRRGSLEPTKEEFRKSFKYLKTQIAAYKEQNPGAETMVFITLTGHGSTRNGTDYFYETADGPISGEQIAEWVLDLEASEVILVVQSCQSGTLAADDFPVLIGEKLIEREKTSDTTTRLLVMTPAHAVINSPLVSWEQILEQAFERAETDANRDDIYQVQEWINQVLLGAIEAPDFIPYEAVQLLDEEGGSRLVDRQFPIYFGSMAGIFPTIFEHNFGGDRPLLLTRNGIQRYLEQREEWPVVFDLPLILRPEVIEAYRVRALELLESMARRAPSQESTAYTRLRQMIEILQNPNLSDQFGCHMMVRSVKQVVTGEDS